MPLRRSAVTVLLLALAGLLPAAAPAAAKAPKAKATVINGTNTTIAARPFQVALLNAPSTAVPNSRQFCGGAIRDATHVITAAHCVTSGTSAVSPSTVQVLAGTATLRTSGGAGPVGDEQLRNVTGIAVHPAWNPSTQDYDAAVLTISPALDLTTGTPRAVTLFDGLDAVPPGSPVDISGWGSATQDIYADPTDDCDFVLGPGCTFPTTLQLATVGVVDDAACDGAYPPPDLPDAVTLCAAATSPQRDTCQGDSGGPLTSAASGGVTKLAGIVSFGFGCADPAYPGVYAEVRAGGTLGPFLADGTAPIAPSNTQLPGMTVSAPAPGGVATCTPGQWAGTGPFSYRLQIFRSTAAGPVTASASVVADQLQYTVQEADQGNGLFCAVQATGPGGTGNQNSGVVPINAKQVVTPPPVVTPNPTPTPDRTAPTSTVARRTCARTRCDVTVDVADARPTSGVRSLEATASLRYSTTCRRKVDGRTRTRRCTKTAKLKPVVTLLGAGRYVVRVGSQRKGLVTVAVRGVDQAGNRQATATTTKVTLKGPKPKRKRR